MKLSALLGPDCVVRLRATCKAAALAELSRLAAARLGTPAAAISAAVTAREMLGSTGVGGGIALPHARLSGLEVPAGFFGRLDRPIDWRAVDGRPVDLVFLLLSPAREDAAHLAALAAVSRRLREPAVAVALRAAASIREMLPVLAEER